MRRKEGLQRITFKTRCVRREGVGWGGGRRHERAGEMNWMLFFFPNSMKKRAMGSEGFYSQSRSQVIHHSALSKELSTTWDEQWHCDCRDRRARDWKISAICWASQRRPKAREGGLKVEEEDEGLERLADENQKILTPWHGCQQSCLRNSCGLQIWTNSREERERESRWSEGPFRSGVFVCPGEFCGPGSQAERPTNLRQLLRSDLLSVPCPAD